MFRRISNFKYRFELSDLFIFVVSELYYELKGTNALLPLWGKETHFFMKSKKVRKMAIK